MTESSSRSCSSSSSTAGPRRSGASSRRGGTARRGSAPRRRTARAPRPWRSSPRSGATWQVHYSTAQLAARARRRRRCVIICVSAVMSVAAGAAELPVAARADPAAGRDEGRQRAAADGACDAVRADAGARAGAGARQPRRGHGAAQPAAPRRHAQGRRQVARRLAGMLAIARDSAPTRTTGQVTRSIAGRRHLGRQPADAGGGGRADEAEGGGRDQARESPRLRLLASGTAARHT